jgi:hypothetical protein
MAGASITYVNLGKGSKHDSLQDLLAKVESKWSSRPGDKKDGKADPCQDKVPAFKPWVLSFREELVKLADKLRVLESGIPSSLDLAGSLNAVKLAIGVKSDDGKADAKPEYDYTSVQTEVSAVQKSASLKGTINDKAATAEMSDKEWTTVITDFVALTHDTLKAKVKLKSMRFD